MSFTSVPGARLYWKLEGRDSAPVLVLLNSIGTDMDLWDPVLPLLRPRFRLLRIDTRGHGASISDAGDFSLALLARDVLAIADAAGIDRFSLAGVSLGGMIAMELALADGHRLDRLALICTSAAMDPALWEDRVTKVRGTGMEAVVEVAMGRFLSPQQRQEDPALYETIRRQLETMDPEGYAGCGAAIRDMDLSGRIAGIAVATLVITGTRDTSTPLEGHGDHLLAAIPGAVHSPLDCAHLAPLCAPGALAEALISFLEGPIS